MEWTKVITNKQKKFLKELRESPDIFDKGKITLYLNRIQTQIDHNIENALWLAKYDPDLLLNNKGLNNNSKHKRLQDLLLLIKILKPECDVYLEIARNIREILPSE